MIYLCAHDELMAAYAREPHLRCHTEAFQAHENKKTNELLARRSRPTMMIP